MEGITVTDVVEHAGVHRTHLYCEFIRVYGISPSHYLMKSRMERAVPLTETDVSVTEAAFRWDIPTSTRSREHLLNITTCRLPRIGGSMCRFQFR